MEIIMKDGKTADPIYKDAQSVTEAILRMSKYIQENAVQGPQGAQGPQGEKGEKGEKGDTGEGLKIDKYYPSVGAMQNDTENIEIGQICVIQNTLDLYIKTNSTLVPLGSLKGPQGDKGTSTITLYPLNAELDLSESWNDGTLGEGFPIKVNGEYVEDFTKLIPVAITFDNNTTASLTIDNKSIALGLNANFVANDNQLINLNKMTANAFGYSGNQEVTDFKPTFFTYEITKRNGAGTIKRLVLTIEGSSFGGDYFTKSNFVTALKQAGAFRFTLLAVVLQ